MSESDTHSSSRDVESSKGQSIDNLSGIPHRESGFSPPLIRPQPKRPSPKSTEESSFDDINTSLSFLIREAAQLEKDRRLAKSRQSQRSRLRANSRIHSQQNDSSQDSKDIESIYSAYRSKSPWYARDAIQAAQIAPMSFASRLDSPVVHRSPMDETQPYPFLAGSHATHLRDLPDRLQAHSTPPLQSHPHRPESPFIRTKSPFQRARTPAFMNTLHPPEVNRHTPFPEHQTANLAAQLEMMISSSDSDEGAELLQRMRKASSARSHTPKLPSGLKISPLTPKPQNVISTAFTQNDSRQDHQEGESTDNDHLLLKGDEHDSDVISTLTRTTTRSSDGSRSVRPMSDEEKLQAIVEEFGPAPEMPGVEHDQSKEERVLGSQAGVLVRRVLIRGYLVLTTHRLCFIALLPANPTKHRILQQGPAILHRPGLTRRKRKAWFTLSSENIVAYRSSTELYEPLGGARLTDIDDVQPAPREKTVHFRVKGKKISMEFEISEAAAAWQREIDAAIFMSTHQVDKIRLCIPLVRIAHMSVDGFLEFAHLIHFDVLDIDAPKHRIPRLHRSDRDPHSTTDVMFSIVNDPSKLLQYLPPALEKSDELRNQLDKSLWYTLPTALIDIDGPRANSEEKENDNELVSSNLQNKAQIFKEQFSLDCTTEEIMLFKVHLVRTLPLAGTLAITPKHLCFYRRHRWTGLADTRIRIPFQDMKGATSSAKAFTWHHHGIRLQIRAHEDMIYEVRDEAHRDTIVQMIQEKIDKQSEKVKNGPKVQKNDTISIPDESDVRTKMYKRTSTQSELFALQDRNKTITISPAQINMIPRAINVARGFHISVKPMKIHCLTIGSRGDVQPYIAICKRLQKDHHTCTIVSHEEYREWVEGNGIAFRAVGGDPGELMKLSVENNKMLFSPQFYREAMGKFRHWLDELLRGIMETCWDADLIIESPSTFGGIHVAEAIGCYYMRAFTMPWTKTSVYPQAFSVPTMDLGPQYNAMSYTIFDQVLWLASSGQINRWRKHMLHLAPTGLDKLDQNSVPFMYNFSPAVVPPPLDWGDRIKITGYWNLTNDSTKWDAPEDLQNFIKKAKTDEKKLCYIGFGSITMDDPIGVQANIYEAIRRSDVRAIVSKGWSGRMTAKKAQDGEQKIPEIPEEAYVVDSIPHDWLFPKIDIAMHHGGAGTTGASLRAGLVTLIHPFFGDQYFWSGRVAKLGAGVRVKSLSVDDITEALCRARDERLLREKAQLVGESIRKERGLDDAREFIYHNLDRSRRTKRAFGGSGSSINSNEKEKNDTSLLKSMSMPATFMGSSTLHSILPNKDTDSSNSAKSTPTSETPKKEETMAIGEKSKKTWTTEAMLSALPMERLRRTGSLSVKSVAQKMHLTNSSSGSSPKLGSKSLDVRSDNGESSQPSEMKHKQSDDTLKHEKQEKVYTEEPQSIQGSDENEEKSKFPTPDSQTDENEANGKQRKSWYTHPMQLIPTFNNINIPSIPMPHLNFLDLHLNSVHLSHSSHSEAAAFAKEKMTEEEKQHANKEENEHHLNARQEDQRRRQLLEEEWRKAKRFDLLGQDATLDVQPEEDEDEEENLVEEEGDGQIDIESDTAEESKDFAERG